MTSKTGNLVALRALVAEKFPQPDRTITERFPTGCATLDRNGGLIRGGLTEVCGSAAGSQLVVCALMEAAARQGSFLALIDAADAFEPADWPEEQLNRLLWVRCREASLALKVADVLIRDGNLPVLLLDLHHVPPRQLQRIPVGTWHRFHRVLESSDVILLTLTPRPLVEGAPCRIAVRLNAPWQALQKPRNTLLHTLETEIFERGNSAIRLAAAEGVQNAA